MEFDDEFTEETTEDVETEILEETDGYEEFCQSMLEQKPDLTEADLEALWTPAGERNYMQTELVDTLRHPEYEAQRSILTDPETGMAVLDENGEFVECPRNTKGAQRPDGMLVDDTGVHLREAKNYGGLNNLINNIREQTANRETAFGQDVDITYVVEPRFTIEEADRLQAYVEENLGKNLELSLK